MVFWEYPPLPPPWPPPETPLFAPWPPPPHVCTIIVEAFDGSVSVVPEKLGALPAAPFKFTVTFEPAVEVE